MMTCGVINACYGQAFIAGVPAHAFSLLISAVAAVHAYSCTPLLLDLRCQVQSPGQIHSLSKFQLKQDEGPELHDFND